MAVATVQARGQVTVPQEVREACGIGPGTDLVFVPMGQGRFECRALPPRRSIREVVARYTVAGVAPDMADLRAEIGEQIAQERGTQGGCTSGD